MKTPPGAKPDEYEITYHLKNKKVMKHIEENQSKIKSAHLNNEEYHHLLEYQQKLDKIKMEISKWLGIDVLK